MYLVNERDVVVEMRDMPHPCVPADAALSATEFDVSVSYLTAVEKGIEARVCVDFQRAVAVMFGGPNDEALAGHPLWTRGLKHYKASEVLHSSWVRQLERMNSTHPRHDPRRYASLRHFVFTFQDKTLECVADGYQVNVKPV